MSELLKNKYVVIGGAVVAVILLLVLSGSFSSFFGGSGTGDKKIDTVTATEGSTVKKLDATVNGNVEGGLSQ